MNQYPKLSIITVCKNAAQSIEKTIQSVVNQTYINIEYIIIDGNSTDGTMNCITHFNSDTIKVISEPDNGIYEAMNKGIALSTGDFIAFLNAGDYYFSQYSIEYFMQHLSQRDCDLFFGNVIWIDNENKYIISAKPNTIKDRIDLFYTNFPHPATFYRRDLFLRVGFFDTNFKILADYEWNLRALLIHKISFHYINSLVAAFSTGGISTNSRFSDLLSVENQQIRAKYYSKIESKLFSYFQKWDTNSLLRKLGRKIFRLWLPQKY